MADPKLHTDTSAFMPQPRRNRPPQTERQETQQERNVNPNIGIFNAECDSLIANRLVEKLTAHGCGSERFDFIEAGLSKIELLESFILNHDLVIWIATHASLEVDNMLKTARYVSQYAATCRRSTGVRYVTFKPREYLNTDLPLILDAYVCLKENDNFDEGIEKTLSGVRDEMRTNTSRCGNSAAATEAMDGHNNVLTLPTSDRPTVEIMATGGDGRVELAAEHDAPGSSKRSSNPDNLVDSTPPNKVARLDEKPTTPVRNVFVINNAANVQINVPDNSVDNSEEEKSHEEPRE